MKSMLHKRLIQTLSLVLSAYYATALIYTDNRDLHLFCDGDMFILIDHYGEKRVYFDNGKEELFVGYLTEYSLPGMRTLFVEMSNTKRCMIGKVDFPGDFIEVRVKGFGLHDHKKIPLDNGYFIMSIAGEDLSVYEGITAFDLVVKDNNDRQDASKKFDPPFSPYYFSVVDIAEDYEWSRAKSRSALP